MFENYPVDGIGTAVDAGGLRLADVAVHDATHYPLSLGALPEERLRLRLNYRPDLFDRDSATVVVRASHSAARGRGCEAGAPDRSPRHSATG